MLQEEAAKDTRHSNLICSSTLLRYPILEQNNQEILEKELKSESEKISILNNVNKRCENISRSISYINKSVCVRVIDLTENQNEKDIFLHHTNCNETIEVANKTDENNYDKDRIPLVSKRNTKENIENDKMIGDNNLDTKTKVISDSMNCQINQNSNDNCDSNNKLLFTCKNEINKIYMTKIKIYKIRTNIMITIYTMTIIMLMQKQNLTKLKSTVQIILINQLLKLKYNQY